MSRQVTERIPERAPAFFFIDIQPDQQQRFRAIVDGIPAVTEVRTTPMVRGRITRVNDVDAETLSVGQDSAWALRGDRGLTYSASPPEGSEIVAGDWWAPDYAGPPLISFDAGIAEGFGVGIGDTITLDVLGRPITATRSEEDKSELQPLMRNSYAVFCLKKKKKNIKKKTDKERKQRKHVKNKSKIRKKMNYKVKKIKTKKDTQNST